MELRFEGGTGSGTCGGGEMAGPDGSSEGDSGEIEPSDLGETFVFKTREERRLLSDCHSRGVIVPIVVGVGAREPLSWEAAPLKNG